MQLKIRITVRIMIQRQIVAVSVITQIQALILVIALAARARKFVIQGAKKHIRPTNCPQAGRNATTRQLEVCNKSNF